MNDDVAKAVLAVGVGGVLLRWHAWRAWLCVAPASVRVEVDTPQPVPPPEVLSSLHAQLLERGFVMLGTHVEHPRFGPALLVHDYAHEAQGAFASTFVSTDGHARCYLLTRCANQGLALTANYPRVSEEISQQYVVGHLDGVGVERLLNAHTRRAAAIGPASGPWTLDERVVIARRWYATVGGRELRHQNAVSLLWTLGALGMVGAALFKALT